MELAQKLPRYRSHKIVEAVKIRGIVKVSEVAALYQAIPVDPAIEPFMLPAGFLEKHEPKNNGYIVFYPDGYVSFSPVEPFEDGYTQIENHILGEEWSRTFGSITLGFFTLGCHGVALLIGFTLGAVLL